jgi:hypothetical protein
VSVRQLLESTPYRELIEDWAYYQLEPYGHDFWQLLFAALQATIAASQGAKDVKIKDFLLDFDQQPQTSEEMKAQLIRMAAAFGAGQGGLVGQEGRPPSFPDVRILNPQAQFNGQRR